MKLLNDYFDKQKELFEYFGYVEDYVAIPLDDNTESFWRLDITGDPNNNTCRGEVVYADTEEDLDDWEAGQFYSAAIYTQRFLPQFIYRGKDYTMVSADTQCDGNKFLMIFDNSKEVKDSD